MYPSSVIVNCYFNSWVRKKKTSQTLLKCPKYSRVEYGLYPFAQPTIFQSIIIHPFIQYIRSFLATFRYIVQCIDAIARVKTVVMTCSNGPG